MKVVMAGQGAFGVKHLEAMQKIDGIEVVSLVGGSAESTKAVAERFGIPHWTLDLAEGLAQPGVQAAILATPTQMHTDQAIQCLEAGKHVQVEIPMADSLADAERLAALAAKSGKVAMAGTTRRTRWTCSTTRPARPARWRAASRGRCTLSWASPWTCRSR